MTKARDTGEVLNTRGTAATADVQTSPTDTTAGALMAVGAFGLGELVLATSTDFNTGDFLKGGKWLTETGAMSNAPAGYVNGRHTVEVTGGVPYVTQTLYGNQTNKGMIWNRTVDNGTWSAWQRTDPQAFGLGGNAIINNDADSSVLRTEIICNSGLGQNGFPDAGIFTVHTFKTNSATLISQIAIRNTSTSGNTSSADIYIRNTTVSGFLQAWQPVYTGANYQPETIGGVGVVQMMQNASGGNQFAGNDYAGSLLRFTKFVAGVPTADGTPVTSVWKYLGNSTLANLDFSMYVRIS